MFHNSNPRRHSKALTIKFYNEYSRASGLKNKPSLVYSDKRGLMQTRIYKTNLSCDDCVATAAPFLNAERSISTWSVDTNDARKPLTVAGEGIEFDKISAIVAKSGFKVFEEIADSKSKAEETAFRIQTYYPLLLILIYLCGGVFLAEAIVGEFSFERVMRNFMGGFFIIFSFFKLLNLKGFANAYRGYDVIAKRVPAYGYVYPFIELALGVGLFSNFKPAAVNGLVFIVMSVSTIGVLQSVLSKRAIQCACLGTVFNLPMSKVTLFEDLLMVVMSLGMLLL